MWCAVVAVVWLLQQPTVAGWLGLAAQPGAAFPPPDAGGQPEQALVLDWAAALRWLGTNTLIVGGFFVANLGLGSLLLPLLVRSNGLERLVQAFALGTVVTGLALFGLALAGLFTPAAVIILGLLCGAAGLAGRIRHRRPHAAPSAGQSATDDEGLAHAPEPQGVPRVLAWASLVALGGGGLLLLLRSAIPDLDIDSVEFHRVAINQIIRTGRLDICWENYAANRPLQLELFQAVAFDLRSASALIQALFTWLTALAVAALLWRRIGPTLALFGAALYLLDQSVLWRAAIHANENAMAFFTVVGLGALANHLEGRGKGWVVLGGALIGFSVGTYYIALLSVVATAGALLLAERLGGKAQRRRWLIFAVVCGLALAPWLLRNLVQLGNPVYPLLYHWFGGRGLHPTAELLHTALGDHLFLDRNPAWLVLLLFGVPKQELFNALMLVFWPAGVTRREGCARLLGAWALAYYLLWFALLPQDRFLIPMKGVLAALAGLGAHTILHHLDPRMVRRACAVLALLLLGALGVRWSAYGPMALETLSRMLRDGNSRPALFAGPLETAINQLPASARVAGISSGHFQRQAYAILPVGFFDVSKMQDADGVARELKRFRITHLVTPRRRTMAWHFWSAAEVKDPQVRALVDAALAGIAAFQRQACATVRQVRDHQICTLRTPE